MSAEKPQVTYPCWWTYAIVGQDEEDLRLVAAQVGGAKPHRIKFSKLSPQKNFASLHVEIEVASEEERDQVFNAFAANPKVRFVL